MIMNLVMHIVWLKWQLRIVYKNKKPAFEERRCTSGDRRRGHHARRRSGGGF
jgi:hypothetical protein